jgi:signal transduction histidine kinase
MMLVSVRLDRWLLGEFLVDGGRHAASMERDDRHDLLRRRHRRRRLLLLRWATRPLRDLAIAAERFSLDQTPQPSENRPGEVRRAARAFNTMRERIQRLVTERMQAMAAVSHDLRTPITRLRLRSELLEDEATRDLIDADLGRWRR